MAKHNARAVILLEGETLVGICTERDMVFRVLARGLDPRTTSIGTVMTRAPHTIGPDQPLGCALLIMHNEGFRHLPVVENGKVIGVVSSCRAMDPDLEEFVSEAERRKHFLGVRGSAN